MDLSLNTVAPEYRREYTLALESFPFKALKAWGAVALLFSRGFRGSYSDIFRQLGWLDRHGKPVRSRASYAIRTAKKHGAFSQDAFSNGGMMFDAAIPTRF